MPYLVEQGSLCDSTPQIHIVISIPSLKILTLHEYMTFFSCKQEDLHSTFNVLSSKIAEIDIEEEQNQQRWWE